MADETSYTNTFTLFSTLPLFSSSHSYISLCFFCVLLFAFNQYKRGRKRTCQFHWSNEDNDAIKNFDTHTHNCRKAGPSRKENESQCKKRWKKERKMYFYIN